MIGLPTTRVVVLVALLSLAAAVGAASVVQRDALRTAAERSETAQGMLEAMLDQETGLRGFVLAGGREGEFLTPYESGGVTYRRRLARARRQAAGDAGKRAALEQAATAAQRWRLLSDRALNQVRIGQLRDAYDIDNMRARKYAMDRYRSLIGRYQAVVRADARELESRAVLISILLVAGLGGAFALAGSLIARRARRLRMATRAAEQAFASRQRDLNYGLQVTESEEEAQGFLQRHLEQSVRGSEVVVLKRNNSANRLLPGTPLAPGSRLEDAFADAEPRSCLAIRLAQRRTRDAESVDSVLECRVCGRLDTQTTCSPLLVGGEVIGSVLIGHPGSLSAMDERALDESVKQAAPVLANLRNLAIAETRAATDGLTGLPNRRAFEESLRRMAAHANRAMSPLAAVALDLDHFKQINDVYGHGRGDEVLAEVGALLSSMVRDSDLVARVGGEEFFLLLPDTGRDGALVICERIRLAIQALTFPALGDGVTASLGIAVLPDDETEAANLVRAADRMLYAAKDRGRNRVEMSELVLESLPA